MKNPKSILITGGSSGIGKALCLSCAAPEITISFSGRDRTRVDEVAALVREKGADVNAEVIDVTDADRMKEWIQDIDDRTPLDLVIANAGIGVSEEMNIEDSIRLLFNVNVLGVINTVLPVIERMRERRRGQIGIISSLAGYIGMPDSPAYSASKAAVKAYGKGLRTRLKKDGIEVSVICPGWILTRITEPYKDEIPFFVSMDYSVKAIRKGLERNRGLISFPPGLAFITWWLSTMPDRWQDFILEKVYKDR